MTPIISTRAHGAIDYAAAGLLAALSRSGWLPRPVRTALGSAAAYHTGYSLFTEYEAGLRPVIPMRTHLALDAVGALALCGAGLAMRRAGPGPRALLLAAGLSELAVVALSATGPGAHAHADGEDSPAYPPLDTLKPVAAGVWIVDSTLPGVVGKVIGARMTVLRLASGDLLLHSPTRLTAPLRAELDRLGPVRHLVAPNLAHLSFIADWQATYPGATVWAAPGVEKRGKVRNGTLRIDRELRGTPAEWRGEVEVVLVPGGAGFTEAALFHRPTDTLVLTDLVLNLEPPKVPLLLRPVLRLFGSLDPDGMPPPYLRALLRMRRRPLAAAARKLLDLAPERVIFAHGRWFQHRGTEALRHALRWALGG